jgi:iron complex transport system permease protein
MTTTDLARERASVQPGVLEALRRRPLVLGLVGLSLLLAAIVAGVALGTVSIPPAETIAILAHQLGWGADASWAQSSETIVVTLRLPRVLTALVVGLGLSVAGVTFQGLLRNPLADPYVLGTASGAALGAAIGVLLPIQVA